MAADLALDDCLDFTLALAREAGVLLRDRLLEDHTEAQKRGVELVTEVDRASERLIVDALRERFPDHAIEAEEGSGQDAPSPYRWFVDPLDGTNNYAHGYPSFCLSLALWRAGQPLMGVVLDPLRDECFWARRGRGAALNGRPLCVSRRSLLGESLVSTGFPYDKASRPDNNLFEIGQAALRVQGLRRSGSAALDLCYVAAGRQEGHWERGLKPWDVAAGGLIVLEAGGRVTGVGARPWDIRSGELVASNGLIHEELLDLLGWR
ncbi:MAG: inositol monophosphatase [Chloroflexia bacterium]|nr:inositol monophosphatase [Chloroflexia bacterium]